MDIDLRPVRETIPTTRELAANVHTTAKYQLMAERVVSAGFALKIYNRYAKMVFRSMERQISREYSFEGTRMLHSSYGSETVKHSSRLIVKDLNLAASAPSK